MMQRTLGLHRAAVVLTVVSAVAISACGKSNPASPSATPFTSDASRPPSTAGATIGGQVSGSGGTGYSRFADLTSGLTVSVAGTNVKGSVDGAGRFSLDNVPAGNVDLQFAGGGINARVALGQVAERERVEVQVELAGAAGNLTAVQHVTPDNHAELKGRIVSVDASARTIRVGTSIVAVPSSASIHSGAAALSFGDLKAQLSVEVHGTLQGATVLAQEVDVEDAVTAPPQPDPDPGSQNEVEFGGSLAGMGGSCPSLTLTVAGRTVRTTASTTFVKAACGDLKEGMAVEVKGTAQSDGSVLASQIQVDDAGAPEPEPEVEFTGSVASFSGSCPSLTLAVGGKTVKTSSATEFAGGGCSDVRAGITLEVKGTMASDGSVNASRVKIDK